jgi:ubiquinone/menaquinone biosynthesis C-methylase UbiE
MIRVAVGRALNRASWHYRNGTLWYALSRKVAKIGRTYRKPKGNQYYGDVAEGYAERRSKQDWWHTEQSVMRELLRDVPAGAKVLDVPFGTGRFVPYYLEKGMEVHGIDISDAMIAAAGKELGAQFEKCTAKVGDATRLPYPDASFDVVSSFRFLDTILSFGDAKKALAEFSRVTKSQAILEISVRKESLARPRLPREDEVMGGLLYPRELEELLATFRLRIVKKSDVIKDTGDWHMHAYLCEKIA